MTIRFAERLARLGTESAFEVLAHARLLEAEGRSIVHLEIGEPDFATPDNITDAAVRAMREGATHYTAASGIREVREKTAAYVTRHTGVSTQFENIVLTPGSKNLLLFALLALIEEGDEVIVPDPGYPIYRSLVEFIGARAISLPLRQENDFRADVDELARLITPRTRMLVVNSPQNPTGGILTRDDIEAIAAMIAKRDILVISDEIYNRHCYDAPFASYYGIAQMPERTVLVDGFSKAWAMTGWRLGFGVYPTYIAQAVGALMLNTISCTATFVQDAGIAALTGDDKPVQAMHDEFLRRRHILVEGLRALPGVTCQLPGGAFYVFPNFSAIDPDDVKLSNYILDTGNVAVLGGSTFGPHGKGFIRMSYANSEAHLREALERIKKALSAYRRTA